MERASRRDVIKASAQRLRHPKHSPMRRPRRVSGRWSRTGSLTLTCYGVGKDSLAQLIREMIEARANEIEEGEGVKCHVQIGEKRRQP